MENPFTLTFGKEPLNKIDRSWQKEEIIENFSGNHPSNQVYMITGVRGSGKTVLLTEIGKHFGKMDDWIAIDLTPELDLLKSLAAELYNYRGLMDVFRRAKLNLSFLGIGVEIDGAEQITDLNVAIRRMLESIRAEGKRVLITIDEAVCNKTMREFASVFQIYMRQELPVFLVLSGLYEKIHELQNEKTLTFLCRVPTVELQPLNIGRIADRYQKIFNLSDDVALDMAKETRGYSFAFQVLGYLTWKKKTDWHNVILDYRQHLEEYVYQKLWSEISQKDKEILIGMVNVEDMHVGVIREYLGISSSLFGIYRQRLIKKGIIIASSYGCLTFALPQFEVFVQQMQY